MNARRWLAWAVWPAGLLLTFAYAQAHAIPTPVFLVLDVAYVALAVFALRGTPAAMLLAAPGVLIFALASLTGVPTARAPGAMLANAAALLVAALLLLAGHVSLASRAWGGAGRLPAALAVVTLSIATAGYLMNLLARFAVVLAGAAPAQAAVEDRAWQAHAYLRGLDGEPSPIALLLVWLDLLQVAYVVLAYVAAGLLVVAARRAGLVGGVATRVLAGLAALLAVVALAAAGTGTVPGIGETSAGIAFALTIPFMSTLLAALLGAALAGRAVPE